MAAIVQFTIISIDQSSKRAQVQVGYTVLGVDISAASSTSDALAIIRTSVASTASDLNASSVADALYKQTLITPLEGQTFPILGA